MRHFNFTIKKLLEIITCCLKNTYTSTFNELFIINIVSDKNKYRIYSSNIKNL